MSEIEEGLSERLLTARRVCGGEAPLHHFSSEGAVVDTFHHLCKTRGIRKTRGDNVTKKLLG